MKKREMFNKIVRNIKNVKIQGARNIARQALYAFSLIPRKNSIKKLISLRPTEPMLVNVLKKAKSQPIKEIFLHFDKSQEKINKFVFEKIKEGDIIYTHCHSTNVSNALIYAKKNGKKFQVYNTETRPLYQGRKTAKELGKAGIKVTMFVDSGMDIALSEEQGTKKVNKAFIGADALLKEGIINKIGSGMLGKLARLNKIPVYVIADSWKYSPKKVKIEERSFREVWKRVPKKYPIKIRNPAFELLKKEDIKKIISELGIMDYKKFLNIMKKR